MKTILSKLFEKSIELGDETFSDDQIKSKWIGNHPATIDEIEKTERRLGIKLPSDYKEMLMVSNGFPTSTNAVEPTFQKVSEIDYYRNYEWNSIDLYKKTEELKEVGEELEGSIMIAGFEDEQQFLIIPPNGRSKKWKYWKFAYWIPGEEAYEDLNKYLESVIEFLNDQISKKQIIT
ncbi:MAG TPA: SMI1/KNR4 family protein [Cyclobacteriaceae bacterium]|jgi:cell wall assembly regulator SMI1|nr:SMI1/KNR4 family protein [Cyclobacteriaceae bacterium]